MLLVDRGEKTMEAPSDFENGVLAAARWLRSKGHADLAAQLVREIPTDLEGTEDRVCKQIAAWVSDLDMATRDASDLADDVRERRWRQA